MHTKGYIQVFVVIVVVVYHNILFKSKRKHNQRVRSQDSGFFGGEEKIFEVDMKEVSGMPTVFYFLTLVFTWVFSCVINTLPMFCSLFMYECEIT